jgi:hypothetical protein
MLSKLRGYSATHLVDLNHLTISLYLDKFSSDLVLSFLIGTSLFSNESQPKSLSPAAQSLLKVFNYSGKALKLFR